MIEFLTLFLGLVAGTQDVGVAVDDQVALVEVLLDGELVARLESPTWRGTLELGSELKPHRLEAVARDREGREIGRVEQRLNLPRPTVEASLVLESRTDEQRTARLIWESGRGESPVSMRATLDGEDLLVDESGVIALGEVDLAKVHLLRAEISFPSGDGTSPVLAFGGPGIEETGAQLTAVAVRKPGRGVPGERAARLLSTRAGPANVVTMEREPAVVVVVKGPGAEAALASLETPFDRGEYSGSLTASIGTAGVGGLDSPVMAPQATATPEQRRRAALAFEDDQLVRLVLPHAHRGAGREIVVDLFAVSPLLRARNRGLLWLLNADVSVPGLEPDARVGDAVAMAGLLAAEANRPRAVLVVLADGSDADPSRYPLPVARRYLETLGVPLHVWKLGAGRDSGSSRGIGRYRDLESAYRELQEDLAQQWIAWIEGAWLPAEITAEARAGLSLLAH